MPRAKRTIQNTVVIDGVALVWNLHREQQVVSNDLWAGSAAGSVPVAGGEWRGLAIHVRVAEGVRRELHLEYPPVLTQRANYTQHRPVRPNLSPAKVAAHIRQAIEAGYDPGSRGQPYVFNVEEQPS